MITRRLVFWYLRLGSGVVFAAVLSRYIANTVDANDLGPTTLLFVLEICVIYDIIELTQRAPWRLQRREK